MTIDLLRHEQTGRQAIQTDIGNLTDKLYRTLTENPNGIQTRVKARRQKRELENLLTKEVHHLELTGLEKAS